MPKGKGKSKKQPDDFGLAAFLAQAQYSSHPTGGGDTSMNISIGRLAHLASVVALVAAAFGNVVFGHGGLELVAAGLALHVGGDLLEDVLS